MLFASSLSRFIAFSNGVSFSLGSGRYVRYTPVESLWYFTSKRNMSFCTWFAPRLYTFFIISLHVGCDGLPVVPFSSLTKRACRLSVMSLANSPTWYVIPP